MLVGCSTSPNTIARPTFTSGKDEPRTYHVGGKAIERGAATTILPLEKTYEGLRDQLFALHTAYSARRVELLKEMDVARNIQFLGILAAAWGIAADKTGLRNTGATSAGLTSLFLDQYAVATQAGNYAIAASAVECIFNQVDAIEPAFWSELFDEGRLALSGGRYRTLIDADSLLLDAHSQLNDLYPTIHRAVLRVDLKLQSLQASALPAVVSPEDVQRAVENQVASVRRTEAFIQKFENAEFSARFAVEKNTLDEQLINLERQSDTLVKQLATPESSTPGQHRITRQKMEINKAAISSLSKAKLNAEQFMDQINSGAVEKSLTLPARLDTCVLAMGK